jgi:hypothetical protein
LLVQEPQVHLIQMVILEPMVGAVPVVLVGSPLGLLGMVALAVTERKFTHHHRKVLGLAVAAAAVAALLLVLVAEQQPVLAEMADCTVVVAAAEVQGV